MAQADNKLSALLNYLASVPAESNPRIPALSELSKEIGLSVATLREQLEFARMLGIVEVKPKTGIRKVPFDFGNSIKPGIAYAVASGCTSFHQFADLRKHLEGAYFAEAAQLLTVTDTDFLEELVTNAKKKISSFPILIPTEEHRIFHTHVYKKLENPYLTGMMEAFWDVYHNAGYEVYPDPGYLERIWHYHARIVEEIKTKRYSQGLSLLLEHMEMVNQREKIIPRLSFE